jgi:hypothetical protein
MGVAAYSRAFQTLAALGYAEGFRHYRHGNFTHFKTYSGYEGISLLTAAKSTFESLPQLAFYFSPSFP